MQFLSETELRQLVPSAFTLESHVVKKNKSGYIPCNTPELITSLNQKGWKPVRAYQVKAKLKKNEGFQKHFIHFQSVVKDTYTDVTPELILINSYDARASVKLLIGGYSAKFDYSFITHPEELKHKMITHRKKYEASDKEKLNGRYNPKHQPMEPGKKDINLLISVAIKGIQSQSEAIDKMKFKTLSRYQQVEVAKECTLARWDYRYGLNDTSSLLSCNRELLGDDSFLENSWNLFSLLQYNIVHGGWIGAGDKSIKKLVDPNRAIKVAVKMYDIFSTYLSKQK